MLYKTFDQLNGKELTELDSVKVLNKTFSIKELVEYDDQSIYDFLFKNNFVLDKMPPTHNYTYLGELFLVVFGILEGQNSVEVRATKNHPWKTYNKPDILALKTIEINDNLAIQITDKEVLFLDPDCQYSIDSQINHRDFKDLLDTITALSSLNYDFRFEPNYLSYEVSVDMEDIQIGCKYTDISDVQRVNTIFKKLKL